MEKFNEESVNQICEEVTNSRGVTGLVLGVAAAAVATGIGVLVYLKKKKNQKTETENVEFVDIYDDGE